MKKNIFSKLASCTCAALIFAAGCVAPVGGVVEVSGPPPPVYVETAPPSPGPGYVWIGGAWSWQGHWAWDRGHWDRPPHPGAVWVPHQYSNRNGKHTFVRGAWK